MRSCFTLLAASLLLGACAGAPHPLASPGDVPVDPTLTGAWEMVTNDESAGERMHLWAFNGTEYYVEYEDGDLVDGAWVASDHDRLRVYLTPVGEALYANIQCLDCGDPTWVFLRVDRPTDDELLLTVLDDKLYESLRNASDSDSVLRLVMAALPSALDADEAARFRRISPNNE